MTNKQIKEMDTATLIARSNNLERKSNKTTAEKVLCAWFDDEKAERGNSANFRNNPELKQLGCYQDY